MPPYECNCHANDTTTTGDIYETGCVASNDFGTACDEKRSLIHIDFLEQFEYDLELVSHPKNPSAIYGQNFTMNNQTKCKVLGVLNRLNIRMKIGSDTIETSLLGVLICDNLPVPLHICEDSFARTESLSWSFDVNCLVPGNFPGYEQHDYWNRSESDPIFMPALSKDPSPLAERKYALFYPNRGNITEVQVGLKRHELTMLANNLIDYVDNATVEQEDRNKIAETLSKIVEIPGKVVKQAAKQLGYKQRKMETSKTLFFEKEGVLVDVYYTTKGLKTCLTHPTQGKNALWRGDAYGNYRELIDLLKNPRMHTNVGYRQAEKAKRKCAGCGELKGKKTGFSKNQWMKGAGVGLCKDCVARL